MATDSSNLVIFLRKPGKKLQRCQLIQTHNNKLSRWKNARENNGTTSQITGWNLVTNIKLTIWIKTGKKHIDVFTQPSDWNHTLH